MKTPRVNSVNVTETAFREYLELYHRTLRESADAYLPPEQRRRLWHLYLHPATIRGTVSTQFGVAVEYEPAAETTVTVRRTGDRIEDAVVTCPRHVRATPPCLDVQGARYVFLGIRFVGFPFRLSTQEAHVAFQQCLFTAEAWHQSVHFLEVFGDRRASNWTPELAVARAKDLVLQAVVDLAKAKEASLTLDSYIADRKKKTVLILGSYSGEGRDRLGRISNALRTLGYEPLLVDQVKDHPSMDLAQKVTVLGSMSRFVVVDDSAVSGHIAELMLCKQNDWITVVLRPDGKPSSFMVAGLSLISSVVQESAFDISDPLPTLTSATQWAEERVEALERGYRGTFPWRVE